MAWTVATAITNAHQAIEQRIAAQWVDGSGTQRTPIQWPAVDGIDNLGTIETQPPTDAPWLKVDILQGDSFPFTFGTVALNTNVAVIQLSVYVPRNNGMATLNEYKGYARAIFTRYVGNGLRCEASSVGPDLEERGYLIGIVRTKVEYEEQV